ncbi:MAG TPA: sigma-70 family RNA polymerase sigma factor [Gemmatales bacterium]|nr:sigma-70 family RNA polymerase sigma factor [Gemmatales bacterium]
MVNRITLPLADWVGITSLAAAGDAQLLHRFARAGEQQAFAMLVKRHGPMVWGVIRRLLRSHQDAEDAFQATFLVLAKKAGALRQPQLLANWLHGVAHRTALQLRTRRKILVPLEVEHEPADDTPDHVAWRECGMMIDQAIQELPSSLRIVFLLCQAEGLTTLAASKRLNLPEGTVVSRLHRARKQLQGLLARHGITSAAGAVTLGWSLALPETLSALTVRTLLASTPSALVAGLAQGVLTTMMWIKLTTAAVVVSTVGLVGVGAATFIAQDKGDHATVQTTFVQPQGKKTSQEDRLRQLEAELAEARKREMAMRDQLEAQMKQTEAVQRFLEKNVLATEQKSQAAQEDKARENEAQARQKLDERRRMERQQAIMEAKDRRTNDLMAAKDQLTAEIDHLQKQIEELRDKSTSMLGAQQVQEMRAAKLQQDIEQEIRLAQEQADPDPRKLKELKARRDKLAEDIKGALAKNNSSTVASNLARALAQLQLREKLLLEVDEKLLRMQLKLDEK